MCLLWIDLPATTTWWHFGLWSSLVYTRWSVSPEPNQLPRKTKKWSHLHVHQRYFISSYRCNYTWFHCICICLSYPFFIFLSETAAPAHRWTLYFSELSFGWIEGEGPGNRFRIHQSTASRIIAAWTCFLATALGSICIWLTPAEVQAYLPEEFRDYPDTQVILDCTELRCQTPSSPLLQSEMYSTYKSHCTMKGLVGIAPHGAVTLISGL